MPGSALKQLRHNRTESNLNMVMAVSGVGLETGRRVRHLGHGQEVRIHFDAGKRQVSNAAVVVLAAVVVVAAVAALVVVAVVAVLVVAAAVVSQSKLSHSQLETSAEEISSSNKKVDDVFFLDDDLQLFLKY